MALGDDVARLVREVWRLNQALGWRQRIGWDNWDEPGAGMGRLAKASGATPETVQAWLGGGVQPTVQQALAVLDALPFPAVPELAAANGKDPAQ